MIFGGATLGESALGATAGGPPAFASIDIAAIVPVAAEMPLDYTSTNVDIIVDATVPVLATVEVVYGVAVAVAAVVPVTADLSGVQSAALTAVAAVGVSAAASIIVERYELRGEVRLAGVLVNRRVRAYSRASGALLGEADTVVGKFRVPTGFAADECYATPIDLDIAATDWLPPTANRITSVLALDAA